MNKYLSSCLGGKPEHKYWELHDQGTQPSEGLLNGSSVPNGGHRRQGSWFGVFGRRRIWPICAALIVALCALWSWSRTAYLGHVFTSARLIEDVSRFRTDLPWGAAYHDEKLNREVFWWNQFPELRGYWQGRKTIVPFYLWKPEQEQPKIPKVRTPKLSLDNISPYPSSAGNAQCYIDEDDTIPPPTIKAYLGLPQSMPEPLFGSAEELGLRRDVCYDRINRFAPYGAGFSSTEGGLGIMMDGDTGGIEDIHKIDYRNITWGSAQARCAQKNPKPSKGNKVFVIRTWHDYDYTPYRVMMLRAMISELSIASGGEFTVHFLIHVRDEEIDIHESDEVYTEILRRALPSEFEGMGTLWSMSEMKKLYPPPFADAFINFSGSRLYTAYRSLHWAMQWFATQHPEFDYFWHWELDVRVTGSYYELLHQIETWADKQPRQYAWERSSRLYIPKLHDGSYARYRNTITAETRSKSKKPISGPQLSATDRLPYADISTLGWHGEPTDHITDLITLNPIFDPSGTGWAFRDDITGYPPPRESVPTRAALITISRMSRRLLLQMHQETQQRKRTMFPEMFPAAIAFQYGFHAVFAPHPVWMFNDWPGNHADEVFNNVPISDEGRSMGMPRQGDGYFHGARGSVFGPGEHVFRGATYYSNAAFAQDLWRTWLGTEGGRAEWETGTPDGREGGRMCLPMMVLHPIKRE